MKIQYSKKHEQLIKGIVLGVLFSTEIFENQFSTDFRKRMNGFEPPLKAIVLLKVAELFTGDDELKMEQVFDWVNENYHLIFSEIDSEFIIHCMKQVEFSTDQVRMN
jgi:hypothetical protein